MAGGELIGRMALQMLGNNKMVGLVLGESKRRRREFLSRFGVLAVA